MLMMSNLHALVSGFERHRHLSAHCTIGARCAKFLFFCIWQASKVALSLRSNAAVHLSAIFRDHEDHEETNNLHALISGFERHRHLSCHYDWATLRKGYVFCIWQASQGCIFSALSGVVGRLPSSVSMSKRTIYSALSFGF